MVGDMFIYMGGGYGLCGKERVLLETPILYDLNSNKSATTCVESDIYDYPAAGFDDKRMFKRFYIWRAPPSVYHIYIFSRESNVWEPGR